MALNDIREGKSESVSKDILKQLLERNLIERRGKTRGTHYILSKSYYEFCGEEGKYSQKDDWNANQAFPIVMAHFGTFKIAKMRDFVSLLGSHMSRRQIRGVIDQFVEHGYLTKNGKGSGTTYEISETYIKNSELMTKALGLGLEELKRRREIK